MVNFLQFFVKKPLHLRKNDINYVQAVAINRSEPWGLRCKQHQRTHVGMGVEPSLGMNRLDLPPRQSDYTTLFPQTPSVRYTISSLLSMYFIVCVQ